MGEKGALTSGELTDMLDQAAGSTAAVGPVTTVVSDGTTTVISAATGLADKIVDKSVDVAGDEAAERLKHRREGSGPSDAPGSSETHA